MIHVQISSGCHGEVFLVIEDFVSWLIAVMKVSTQLGNLSGNQSLLFLNLRSLGLFSVDPECTLSLILR